MTEQEINMRIAKARDLFHKGFNCSQSVFASCCDLYDMDEATALRVAASFGGGIGRMRMVCGAASGMFLLAGMHNGSCQEGDAEGKKQNYALVQQLANDFKTENGSLICADLLGLAPQHTIPSPVPAERNSEYYQKRPCVDMVASAVRIFLETINNENK